VMLMRRNFRTGWLGWCLLEGFGEYQEVNAFGNCQVYCSTTGYGEAAPDAKGVGESWKATAKRMAVAGGDSRLQDLFVRGLNDLSPFDLVKSWSLVHYLVALDREKFVALVMAMKGGPGVARLPADEAVRKVYGMSVDELDGKWRDFVRRTY
jgi:hypothetical protein